MVANLLEGENPVSNEPTNDGKVLRPSKASAVDPARCATKIVRLSLKRSVIAMQTGEERHLL
jgi:hypothetical protein